ncbi:class I SAM-dependent methyltransferase [Vibrio tritonius]|uniref:class I SAM-dependent methyltransferase n=1 Tax=Vibrio tritonius TaxID=1435069 RepID=UPI00315DD34C
MSYGKSLPEAMASVLKGNIDGYSISKMSKSDQEFLFGLVSSIKPKNCLEVGVYSGGSSSIILEAIKDIEDSFLIGVDISPKHPYLVDNDIGFVVKDNFPYLSDKYRVHSGKDVSELIDDFGVKFDFALIDTAHMHPCETLNLISILPYMKSDSWIVIHDIGMFYCQDNRIQSRDKFASKYIFDCWQGERLTSEKCEFFTIPNIGAIKVENVEDNLERLISLLFNRWDMEVDDTILDSVRKIIQKHYSVANVEMFDRIIARKKYISALVKKEQNDKKRMVNKVKRYVKSILNL